MRASALLLAAPLLASCGRAEPQAVARTVVVPLKLSANGSRMVYPAQAHVSLPLDGTKRLPVRSLLRIPTGMHFGDFTWSDGGVPAGPVLVRVDLARQMMSVFRGGHEIGAAVILYGTDGKPTPTGQFPVLARAERHRSTLYDAEMPFMLRLTGDGVAIHASDVRQGRATHGCIGVPLPFAKRLFAQVRRGDPVVILPATRA